MQFSPVELRALVAAASSIDERLYYQLLPVGETNNEELIRQHWEYWCQTLTQGNWPLFQRRLAWDHLDEARVRSVLGVVQWTDEQPLPTWTEVLQMALYTTSTSVGQQTAYPFYDQSTPLPFEHVLAPFVLTAWTYLREQAGSASDLLGEQAHVSLQRELLKVLTSYAAQALQLEFSLARSLALSSLDFLVEEITEEGDSKDEFYLHFVEGMQEGGLLTFLQEYAVLARQLATITEHWVEFLVEFLQRLARDQEALQAMLRPDRALGRVSAINAHLSDPHNGRRSVLALTFASGQKVIYKPKNPGIEESFQQLLRWIADRDQSLALKVLQILCRPDYGWIEFVEHQACKTQEEARRYFQRMGMLLCLVYALEGTDCHGENVIACGEHPVLVDSEALMQPRQRHDLIEGVLARVVARQQLLHSVLRTGMLPNWQMDASGQQVYDISALGGMYMRKMTLQNWTWEHINTDQMVQCLKEGTHSFALPGPLLGDQVLQAEEYSADVIEGLRRMYGFLQEQCANLLAEGGPIRQMAQQPVRFIYRNTRVYTTLRRRLQTPEFQRDGVRRSIQLEQLGKAVLPDTSELEKYTSPSSWWPIFATERQAMQHEDIPYYTVWPTNDTLLIPPDSTMSGLFQGPGFELVEQRLRAMNDEDLEKQIAFVAGSFYAYGAYHTHAYAGKAQSEALWDQSEVQDEPRIPNAAELVEHALRIAEQIQRRAIRANNSAIWIAPQRMYNTERYQLQPLNDDLYSGLSGVALFLAAAGVATGAHELHALAQATIAPLRQSIEEYGDYLAEAIGIGGLAGLGSLLFVLTRLSQFLDEPDLLQDARKIVGLITDERIKADTSYDIIHGSAGAILGLLTLYDRTSDPAIIERAEACATHLVHSTTRTKNGQRAWMTIGNKMLAGFSHGMAGIAYALLRLYAITGKDGYHELACESIDYENSLFLPESSNWLDLRSDEPYAETASWCHGAPGIGLARIGGLAGLDNQQIRSDIDAALKNVCALPLYRTDHICCGNMGLVDILLTAALRLQRPELRERAMHRVEQVLKRVQEAGTFIIDPRLPKQLYTPGFFQGTAGIGYTCLRLAKPELFPSILLWE